jgi:hypothetical protein
MSVHVIGITCSGNNPGQSKFFTKKTGNGGKRVEDIV